jgi:hypothetical protein
MMFFSNKILDVWMMYHQCTLAAIRIGKETAGKMRWKGPDGDYNPLEAEQPLNGLVKRMPTKQSCHADQNALQLCLPN